MNINLLNIVKQIIAANGEGILSEPARLKALFSDLAKDEPKPLRVAFGRCIQNGAYIALKTAPDAADRASRKATIAQRLRDEQGLDMALCTEALDILEAVLYGSAQAAYTPPPGQAPHTPAQTVPPHLATPQPVQPPYYQGGYQPPPQSASTTGGKWTAVLVWNVLGFNWVSRFITGHIVTGILVLLLDIVTLVTLESGIGWIGLAIGLIIWIADLVTICSKKWQMADGTYLVP